MGQGSNMLFNVVSLVFLVLTVIVLVVVLGVAAGSMDPPIFAPDSTQPAPTIAPLPTMTPTLAVPGAMGEITPTPEAAQ